ARRCGIGLGQRGLADVGGQGGVCSRGTAARLAAAGPRGHGGACAPPQAEPPPGGRGAGARPPGIRVPVRAPLGSPRARPRGECSVRDRLARKRFFPATLVVDDPFVADELSLPTVFNSKLPGTGDTLPRKETDVSGELAKRLTPDLGLSLGGTWKAIDPAGGKSVTGFDNL